MKEDITIAAGALLFIAAPIFAAIYLHHNPGSKWPLGLCLLVMILSLLFCIQHRINLVKYADGNVEVSAQVDQIKSDALEVESIRQRVENQRDTIDLIARESKSAKELSTKANLAFEESSRILAEMKQAQVKASEVLSELEDRTRFQRTLIQASNDNREAFDNLRRLADGPATKYQADARAAVAQIMAQYNVPIISVRSVPWNQGVQPEKLTFEEAVTGFKAAPEWVRAALVHFVKGRKDFDRIKKLEFYMDIVSTDPNLSVVVTAGRCFSQETNCNLNGLAIPELQEWWQLNKSAIATQKAK